MNWDKLLNNSLQMDFISEAQLRASLRNEKIGSTTLYYSLVKKEGKTISFLTNDRLLIYDSNRRIFFYSNDYKSLPFKNNIPGPKNDTALELSSATFTRPKGSSNLLAKSIIKNKSGQTQTVEWTFIFQNQQLAKQWQQLLIDEKQRLVNQLTGVKGGGFVHDTLINAVQSYPPQQSPPRETILKIDEQIFKSKIEESNQNIRGSQMLASRTSQVKPQENMNSGIRSSKQIPKPNESFLSIKNSQIGRNQEKSFEGSNIKRETSNISERGSIISKNKGEDWNFKFIKRPEQFTLFEFQNAAEAAFLSIWEKDSDALANPRRVYDLQGLKIIASNCFTREASLLKKQFRNYHFIIQSCRTKLVIGVPLTCLIEWQGVVALVKASFPNSATQISFGKMMGQVRQLQRYTRVSNSILQKATLLDLTEIYGINDQNPLIYVDNLIEYLPMHVEEQFNTTSLRPDYLLDSVAQIVPGGEVKPTKKQEWKVLSSVCEGVELKVKQLADSLSAQEQMWITATELKQIFHSFGVNFKFLPRVYNEVTNKYVKKYLQSVMAAKVAKDYIHKVLADTRQENSRVPATLIIEDIIKMLMEGGNSQSSQTWKEIALKFKKQYSIPINNTDILGGFMLNSIIKLLRLIVDPSKINKNKKLFKEEGVIQPGFVIVLKPKIKTYYRFTTQLIERVRYTSREEKKSQQIFDEIVGQLKLTQNSLPSEYALNSHDEVILEYLSFYTPPSFIDSSAPLRHIPIYTSLLQQPPSVFTLQITKAYLRWCVRKERPQQFKKCAQSASKLLDYWLDDLHLYHCDMHELLSDYFSAIGSGEDSRNQMKESLRKCIKICGSQSKKAGIKYYELGEIELKVGHKRQALDNFKKAKSNMESNQNQTLNYPQLLMRLAALHLNSGDIEGCIQQAMKAIKQFDEYDKRTGVNSLTEGYKIKTCQVLSRAYEISGKKKQLREIALICAKTFNKTKTEWVFEQMVRIGLTAVIFGNAVEKCQLFVGFIAKLMNEQGREPTIALRELMSNAQRVVVIQKFLTKFDQLERIISDYSSKKGPTAQTLQFTVICSLIGSVVGEDYIQGLVHQKQYE